ncbi:recombinase family protein [Tissierella praeacuta]|uniref:recombinase family protein n=1 Tax=Tissierella praeacuta TaxID=43131 RepID=UPI0028AE4AAC|nr:recombinase family protein [Tissierella praeacuta]
MDIKDIKKVAIYLRKSRPNEDMDVLWKHRQTLIEYAEKNGWKYELYEEVESGSSLYNRDEMNRLLKDIVAGHHDGLLIMEFQRLTRGDELDYGELMRALRYANCYFITPNSILDPNNKNDKMILRVQGAFATHELDTTIERFQNGKRAGAKAGRLTNGNPPYPYYKERKIIKDEKGYMRIDFDILVDEEKRKVYEKIKEMYIDEKLGTEKIAINLNQQGYKSPGGSVWSSNAVLRLLLHEFHMGIVKYGKYEWRETIDGKRKPTRKRDVDEIAVTRDNARGDWEQLKTEEEHQKILKINKSNQKVPDRAKQGVFPTSSLMYCKKCGYSMKYNIGEIEKKTGKQYTYTKCNHKDPVGNKCTQRGLKMKEDFYEALYNTVITSFVNSDIIERAQVDQKVVEKMETERESLNKELKKQEKALERLEENYLYNQDYTSIEYQKFKKLLNEKIKDIKKEIAKIEKDIINATSYSRKELEQKINKFKKEWKKAKTAQEQNVLLKTIVKRIEYDRNGDDVTLEVEYL